MSENEILLKDNSNETNNKASSPKSHQIKKTCFENKIWKYILCCLYKNYDLDDDEKKIVNYFIQENGEFYDIDNPNHKQLLNELESLVKSNIYDTNDNDYKAIIDSGMFWRHIGFQSEVPYNDFRGAGIMSLKFLIYFIKTFPDKVKEYIELDCFLLSVICINLVVSK